MGDQQTTAESSQLLHIIQHHRDESLRAYVEDTAGKRFLRLVELNTRSGLDVRGLDTEICHGYCGKPSASHHNNKAQNRGTL